MSELIEYLIWCCLEWAWWHHGLEY